MATLILEGTVAAGQGGNTISCTTTAAAGDQTDPSTVGDDLEEAVDVNAPTAPSADLVTLKTLDSGDATPNEGDTVHYHVDVINNGSSTATNVSLTDLLPAGLTPTALNGEVTQGTYNTATGLWNMARWRWVALQGCLLYTSPSPRDATLSRMPSSA